MDVNGIEKIRGITEYYYENFLIIEIIILIAIIFLAYLGYKFFKKNMFDDDEDEQRRQLWNFLYTLVQINIL